ncbi:hypothetical protein NIES4071_68480 [Calothrix sp. NIES-4071]|nr:hypothetical protein NIES4071_68480 [Calothrix sp. NIES-4071]BAZ61126.1 hypothetical protein NIES4105_68440 [Calothrix sp. NIES-4105]
MVSSERLKYCFELSLQIDIQWKQYTVTHH